MNVPDTRYLEHEGVHIAWQVFGDGPAEVMFIPGWVSNVDLFWSFPAPRAFFTELGGFARVAVYDKPGTGASDPVDSAPTAEVRIEQLIGVMDAAGLQRPTVIGVSEGGVTACLAAAARPDRVGRVVLLDATAAGFDARARGALSAEAFAEWVALISDTANHWGDGRYGDQWLAGVPDADAAWGRLQRACATPAVAQRYLAAISAGLSAWDALPTISQPALVINRVDDRIIPIEVARACAQRIPQAQVVELPGAEHLPWLGETADILAHLRRFVGAPPPAPRAERVLAAIMFTDIVGSTDALARVGDAAWTARLQRHDAIVRDGLARFDGRLVKSTGDGVLATFAGPARGTHAARWILDALPAEDLHARAGVHVGEIEQQGEDIAGLAVHVAARIMHEAGPDEVLVSRTARDLMAGSGLRFEDRGARTLRGVPEELQVFALA